MMAYVGTEDVEMYATIIPSVRNLLNGATKNFRPSPLGSKRHTGTTPNPIAYGKFKKKTYAYQEEAGKKATLRSGYTYVSLLEANSVSAVGTTRPRHRNTVVSDYAQR